NGSTTAANKKSTNTASSQKTGILDKAAQGVKKGVTAIANTVEKGYNTLKKEVAKAGKTATDTKKNEKPTAVTKGDKVNATVIRHDARGTKVSSTAAVPVTGGKYGSRGDAPAKTAEKAKALQQEKKELKKAPAGKDKSKKTPASASSQGTVIRHDARGTKISNKTVIPVTGGEHGSRGKTPGKVAEKADVLNQIKKEEKKQEKREKQEEQKQRKQEYRTIPATTDERRKGDSRGAYIPKRIAPPEGVDTSKMPESIHNALSVAGMAPGPLGFIADGINAVTYFFEGETKKAAIAAGEMVVPAIIGKVGGKVALKVSGKLGTEAIESGTEGVVKKITGETTESAGEAVGKKLQKEITENAAEKAAKVTGEAIESGSNAIDYYVGPNGKVLPSQYKDWIGTNIQEELLSQAENPQLKNAIKQLYRGKSFIGDGGTADVIRFEQETGIMLGKNGGSHVQKGIDMASYIQNKILTQNLSDTDRTLATRLLDDLNSALGR
ncbi:MAG: hypothetical protein ACOCM4_13410, partial [Acetivibrio ethanolgignens]